MSDYWDLIQKYLRNQISNSEKEALEVWLNSEKKNRQKFKEIREVWELSRNSDKPVYDLDEEKRKILDKICCHPGKSEEPQ